MQWLSESEDSEEVNAGVLAGRLAYSTNVDREQEHVVVRALDDWREVARVPVAGEISALAWLDESRLLATFSHQAISRPRILRIGEPAIWSAPLSQGSTWGASVTAGGPVWAASALDRPPALYRAAGESVQTLLAPSAGEGYVAGESVTYPSFDDQLVQGWLLRNPRLDAPLVVYVHGGPTSVTMDMWRVEIQVLAQAGYHVFAPNYRGSSSFGTPFRLANIGDLGGGDAQDVLFGARYAADMLGVEALPAITGRSYGGYLTLFALTTQPDEWAGGVAVVPVADWVEDYRLLDAGFRFFDYYFFGGTPEEKPELYRDRSPITHLDRLRAPTLILHGENDSRCPIEPVIHFTNEAKRRGLPVEMVITPAEGHGNQQTASAIRDTVLTLEHLAGLW
jgi:dipeptidyl aminopeptidase/acylaminoacyl peptidase